MIQTVYRLVLDRKSLSEVSELFTARQVMKFVKIPKAEEGALCFEEKLAEHKIVPESEEGEIGELIRLSEQLSQFIIDDNLHVNVEGDAHQGDL